MVGHCYPQNIQYLEFAEFYFLAALFHKNRLALKFTKQLKGNSVLEIFEKFVKQLWFVD